jgi:hypothetical protein
VWIFSETGFVSAICKSGELMQVRARDRQSLEDLSVSTGLEIIKTPQGDYPYRIELVREQFITWMIDQMQEISYKNFKSRVQDTRGYDFVHPLHQVWSVMHDVEDKEARN